MGLRRVLAVFRQRVPLIMVTVLLAAATGWFLATAPVSGYSANFVVLTGLSNQVPSPEEITYLSREDFDVAFLAESQPTLALAMTDAGLATSLVAAEASVTATPVVVTSTIKVTVIDTDPLITALLAASLPKALGQEVAFIHTGSTDGVDPLDVRALTTPTLRHYSSKDQRPGNAALAGLLGLLIALAAALLVDHVDLSVRGPEDCADQLDLPVLGGTLRLSREFGWAPRE